MTLRFDRAAAEELEAAVRWYAASDPSVATRFAAEVRRRVAQAARFPESAPLVRGLDAKYDVRAFGLRGFPYVAITALSRGEHIVVALAHTAREPGYWQQRVR
jgi:plasmid stabilization system protein ParE